MKNITNGLWIQLALITISIFLIITTRNLRPEVFFTYFIISALLLLRQSLKGPDITEYIAKNSPDLYERKKMPYRYTIKGIPAINILVLTKDELDEISDPYIKTRIMESRLHTLVFFISFLVLLLTIMTCEIIKH
jgi:hypothetical protein